MRERFILRARQEIQGEALETITLLIVKALLFINLIILGEVSVRCMENAP